MDLLQQHQLLSQQAAQQQAAQRQAQQAAEQGHYLAEAGRRSRAGGYAPAFRKTGVEQVLDWLIFFTWPLCFYTIYHFRPFYEFGRQYVVVVEQFILKEFEIAAANYYVPAFIIVAAVVVFFMGDRFRIKPQSSVLFRLKNRIFAALFTFVSLPTFLWGVSDLIF